MLRHEGTEAPFTSPLNNEHRKGVFACAGCALDLYSSDTKFDSGTGWPSFWKPLDNAVVTKTDNSLFMTRTEVHCRRCGGHLGHVFDDGPKPTGLRYCMNGVAMTFKADTSLKQKRPVFRPAFFMNARMGYCCGAAGAARRSLGDRLRLGPGLAHHVVMGGGKALEREGQAVSLAIVDHDIGPGLAVGAGLGEPLDHGLVHGIST